MLCLKWVTLTYYWKTYTYYILIILIIIAYNTHKKTQLLTVKTGTSLSETEQVQLGGSVHHGEDFIFLQFNFGGRHKLIRIIYTNHELLFQTSV